MPYVFVHLFDDNVTVMHGVPGPGLCTRARNESNKPVPSRNSPLRAVITQLMGVIVGHTQAATGCHITQNSGEGWYTHSSSQLSQRLHQTGKRLAGGNN